MKKVVYILGAGFSAFAELPVMANFIDKAKDIYFSNSEYKYNKEIKQALDLIREYAVIKNTMNSNLLNIEELLSIYDMKQFVSPSENKSIMQTFIKAVISYYQDNFFSGFKINDSDPRIMASNEFHDLYTTWLLLMFGIETTGHLCYMVGAENKFISKIEKFSKSCDYGIVTFNYDTIIETITKAIEERVNCRDIELLSTENFAKNSIRYCKLHGSINRDTIIPPTWAKTQFPDVKKDWEDAFTLLKSANEIRIIGFSFPETDSHVSYLFKSAIIDNENLKKIDVICMDNNDYVKNKYLNKFCTEKLRFKNKNISDYLGYIYNYKKNNRVNYSDDELEYIHEVFFNTED